MDGYLENAMDYVLETFESANEWMKENDPLKLPMVQAACFDPKGCITITWGSGDGDIGGSTLPSIMSSGGSSNSFSSSGNGNGIGQGSGFNAKGFESLSNPPSTNDLQIVKPLEIPKYEDYAPHPGVEIERQFKEMDRIINGNMGPQVAQNTNTDSGSGGGGTSEQEANSGDNTQAGGSSEESKQEAEAAEKVKQEEAKLKKAEDEFKELKEKHQKILEDTSKSSDANAEARGKAVQDVAEKVIIRGTESVGAGVGFVAGGALGGPLGAAFGAVGGKVVGEKVAEYSIKKAKEVVDEHEKEKEDL